MFKENFYFFWNRISNFATNYNTYLKCASSKGQQPVLKGIIRPIKKNNNNDIIIWYSNGSKVNSYLGVKLNYLKLTFFIWYYAIFFLKQLNYTISCYLLKLINIAELRANRHFFKPKNNDKKYSIILKKKYLVNKILKFNFLLVNYVTREIFLMTDKWQRPCKN